MPRSAFHFIFVSAASSDVLFSRLNRYKFPSELKKRKREREKKHYTPASERSRS